MNNLNLLENYKKKFDYKNINEPMKIYFKLLLEYLKVSLSNLVVQNSEYYLFILKRGIDTITHCFNILFMYSKNLNIVEQSCNKAICYYIEFMGQIGEDSNSYLQLNSKDATLFVYKKILFDIDENFRKDYILHENDKKYIENINLNNKLLYAVLNNILYIEKNNEKKILIENSIKYLTQFLDKYLIKSLNCEDINTIIYFINNIAFYFTETKNYINTCANFVKKYNKKSISIDKINSKIKILKENIEMERFKDIKLVNWFYQK
tara:strand:+ start:37 stop:828 length:792 start_codon:yes stop_codon:yes gene_type:complete